MNKRRGNNSNRASTNAAKVGAVISKSSSDNVAVADEQESNRLNSSAVRRIDPTFAKLHGTASQVAVYRYNSSTQSWDKTDTVGCLFLYERNVPPMYGLVVMNRKNANNFIQKFGPDGQVVLHNPYLLLRSVEDMNNDPDDGSQAIHCIWFYEAQDCVASASILRKMGLKFEGETLDHGSHRLPLQAAMPGSGQLTGNALFQILQMGKKASPLPKNDKTKGRVITAEELESQMLHESEIVKSVHSSIPTQSELKMTNGGTPSSYKLTAASSNSLNLNSSYAGQANSSSVLNQFINMTIKDSPKASKNGGDIVTAQINSVNHTTIAHSFGSQNKMRTVEQLEREMKKSDSSPASAVEIQTELMQTLGIPNLPATNDKTEFDNFQSSASPSQASSKSVERAMLDNIIGKSFEEIDPEHLRQVFQSVEPSNLILVTENIPGANETRLTWRLDRSSSLRKDSESTFTTPTGEFVSASGTRCSSQQGLGGDLRYFDGAARDVKPTPLTKEQLTQSLLYLLQNDSDFIAKIHDGYVKSLQQAYDGRHF